MFCRKSLVACAVLISCVPLPGAFSQSASKQQSNDQRQKNPGFSENEPEALYSQSVELAGKARYGLARSKLFQALEYWQQAKRDDLAIEALTKMGDFYMAASQWQIAIECFERLIKYKSLSNSARTTALISVAWLYFRLRQFDLAISHYKQALRLAQLTKDYSAQARSLTGVAAVYVASGYIEKADHYLQLYRRLQKQSGDESIEGATFRLAGQVYQTQSRITEAREAYEKALAFYRKAGGHQSDEALLLCDISNLYFASGDNQAALNYAKDALKIIGSLNANDSAWRGWLALARAQKAMGQSKEALKSYYRAFGLIEMQAFYFSADTLKMSYIEERLSPYRELVNLLIEMGQTSEAFNVAEHARSKATLDLLAEGRRREKPARKEISQSILQPRTSGLRLPPVDKQPPLPEAELDEDELRREEIRLEAQMNNLRRFNRPSSLKEVQETMLQPNDTLIVFFLAEGKSHAWLVTRESATCITLPDQKEIEAEVGRYLDVITTRPSKMYLNREMSKQTKLAAGLFELLLGKIGDQVTPGRRLIIVPDGLLFYLPFETLIRGNRFLIEDHVLAYVPSASIFGLLRQSKQKQGATYEKDLLALGDPIFQTKDGLPPRQKDKRNIGGAMQGAYSSEAYRLPSLPNSRDEVLSIGNFFPPEKRKILLGPDATEEALKQEQLNLYRILHFATHSLIFEQSQFRSGVVLSSDSTATEESLLETDEIAELDMRCELVVLSACRTGRGKLVKGEGPVGLTRAFLYAGARSVAVSLWNVSDYTTSSFMKLFYRLVASNTSPDVALQQAKLEMIKNNYSSRHPYFWASFVVVGNPD